ncbi:MAG: hypothetical protein AVDCRST_MAG86-2685 [uncultured Truepera sp.]|uniref:Uncharacterized protein n=1 Tax=uncultured Truepera sp. TaxID=543023 RepID=A0A6J4VM95_9DEIN|nr:MAG: hypothetical protein AVDCRST_MAG86-2685 [uncultured Truepera sp.]
MGSRTSFTDAGVLRAAARLATQALTGVVVSCLNFRYCAADLSARPVLFINGSAR